MPSQSAQILIQVRGAVKAAGEFARVAGAVDHVNDQLSEQERDALKTAAAMQVLERQLKQVTRAGAAAAAAASLQTLALGSLLVVTLALAITAMPALTAALGAATVAGLAFGAGIAGIGLAVGVMAAGAVLRFQEMSEVAGSAAAEMKTAALGLKDAFGQATASGADRVFVGLVPLLTAVSALVTDLAPDFTAVGTAIGDALRWFGEGVGELRPELSALLQATTGAFQPLAQVALMLISLFARVATEAMPYVIDALNGLVGLLGDAQAAITNGAIDGAFTTIGVALRGVMAVLGGIASTLGPVLGPAAEDLATTLAGTGDTFGQLIGSVLAGVVQLGQGALPGLVTVIEQLAPAFGAIVSSGVLQTLGTAIGATFGFAARVIGTVVTELQRVGLLKPIILGLVTAFVAWKVATLAVNIALRANPVVMLVTAIAALAVGVVYAYRRFEGFRRIVDGAWGILKSVGTWIGENWKLIVGFLTGPIGAATIFIVSNFGKIKDTVTTVITAVRGLVTGVWDGLKTGFVAVLNWIIGKLNGLIDGANKINPFGDPLGRISPISDGPDDGSTAGASHPIQRAFGGPIFGGTPGRDSVLALLMPGEHVLTAGEVRAAGGHGAIYGLRSALAGREPARFATGGPVRSAGTSTHLPLRIPPLDVHIPVVIEGREIARVTRRIDGQDEDRQS